MGTLDGKIALVTGAAQGIGLAIADVFQEAGATVIRGDIRSGSKEHDVKLDVTDESDWQRVVSGILDQHGRIDVLVNNAGIVGYEPIHETSQETWHRVVAVNLTGTFLGLKAVLPSMRLVKRGSIVNICSIWGNVGVGGAASYNAAKGGVRNLTKNAAVTYAAENVRINSVHPGLIRTPLVEAQPDELNNDIIAKTPMGRMGSPREVAQACLFLASDDSSFVTGSELAVDGGYLAQ